jgi:dienelactone hydrolase
MLKIVLLSLGLLASTSSQAWFNSDYPEPPPIVRTNGMTAEEMIRMNWGKRSTDEQIMRYGLQPFQPLIPDWSKKKSGNLLASWNPVFNNQKNPTVVLQHGGVGGPGPTEWGHGAWFKKQGYNVLVLDSFWSRGFVANWRKIDGSVGSHGRHMSELGANTRARDAFATARWLRERPEVDSNRIYLIGGSQGGWSVLRAFTDEKSITEKYKGLFRAGISIYPVCWSWQRTPGNHGNGVPENLNPRLGPFHSPLLILTVGLEPPGSATDINVCDPNIIKSATKHIRYHDQTHAFDSEPAPGAPRGRCWYSANPHWCGASGGRDALGNCKGSPKPDMCEDATATDIARQDMLNFLEQFK